MPLRPRERVVGRGNPGGKGGATTHRAQPSAGQGVSETGAMPLQPRAAAGRSERVAIGRGGAGVALWWETTLAQHGKGREGRLWVVTLHYTASSPGALPPPHPSPLAHRAIAPVGQPPTQRVQYGPYIHTTPGSARHGSAQGRAAMVPCWGGPLQGTGHRHASLITNTRRTENPPKTSEWRYYLTLARCCAEHMSNNNSPSHGILSTIAYFACFSSRPYKILHILMTRPVDKNPSPCTWSDAIGRDAGSVICYTLLYLCPYSSFPTL